ncbi:hypothetical protein ['Camptotheca acuminata' phytoplasma]|uniref:hypothetical protein n=1 Tax='Camptotheca acuminata' phytoplasma TaxID=3239192 RepID=UPI00351A2388
MRILPHELYPYSPNLSLCALRKEFGIYDFCLNKQKYNQAMNPFLQKGRNYFNFSIFLWAQEMQKRKNYVNSFHLFYALNNPYQPIETDLFLILECCIQWDIKKFIPYLKINNLSWFNIFCKISKSRNHNINFCNQDTYNELLQWYKINFMKENSKGLLKPYRLNMEEVIKYFNQKVNFDNSNTKLNQK